MLSPTLRHWAAWAPERSDEAQWRAWAAAPARLPTEGTPDARFLPAMLRRRCTPLTRTMLTAAFASCPEDTRSEVRTVFASRHGSINESLALFEALGRRERISPARFSHTVHNAQAGLFSIAAGNRHASSSLSAQDETFGCAWLEAITHLDREPERSVLLVIGDVPLAPTFAPLVDEPAVPYALALVLGLEGSGTPLRFGPAPAPPAPRTRPWPDALEFLRWLLSDTEGRLALGTRCGWVWERA